LEKKLECNETVRKSFIDFEKAFESVRKEMFYNILTEFGTTVKLVWLTEIRLNEPYIEVRTGEISLMRFLFRMV